MTDCNAACIVSWAVVLAAFVVMGLILIDATRELIRALRDR